MFRCSSLLGWLVALATKSVVGSAFAAGDACGHPATRIAELREQSSLVPDSVWTIEAVVTLDLQGAAGLGGFFVQEEAVDQDDDPTTAEGLFVQDEALEVPVEAGDRVRVEGSLDRTAERVTLIPTREVVVCSPLATVAPAELVLPLEPLSALDGLEGMLVRVPGPLFVTGVESLHREGVVLLSWGDRLYQPTQLEPAGERARRVEADNLRNQLRVDDGSSLTLRTPPVHASTDGPLRAGDELEELVGVLDRDDAGFVVQPRGPLAFRAANPRTAAPEDPGGELRVAGFNVKNYFATLDAGTPACGPEQDLDCRGATSASEREVQRAKIAAVVRALDADVLALVEIENDEGRALSELALDASAGDVAYDWVETGPLGSDAIRVALSYRPERVALAGSFAVLDGTVDPSFDDEKHRPVLAQSFLELASGERFTLAVHHLKSKGSPCADDPEVDDGQGACNRARTHAVDAEVAWLEGDPTRSGDPDVLVLGDLNAYGKEDPVQAFLASGYHDLTAEALGARAYSYAFEGRFGVLDPAFASPSLEAQVAGVAIWHVNADEAPDAADDFASEAGDHVAPFRASDHDPIVVGLTLASNRECAPSPESDEGNVTVTPVEDPVLDAGPASERDRERRTTLPTMHDTAPRRPTGCRVRAGAAPRLGWFATLLAAAWIARQVRGGRMIRRPRAQRPSHPPSTTKT